MLLFVLAGAFVVASAQNACTFSREAGDASCGSGGQKYYFDSRTHRCQPFYYKGCNGNGNRFDTRAACEGECYNQPASASAGSSDVHGGGSARAICAGGNVAANDRNGPLPCSRCPRGYECQNGMCCGTKEYTCSLTYDAGRFPIAGSHVPMYFYNREYGNCMLFTYYGTEGNPNTFPDFNACKKFCSK